MSTCVYVVGSLNIDLVTVTSRVPVAGETVIAKSFSTGFGGKGANQAVAAQRLLVTKAGARHGIDRVQVYMNGAVGDDQHGCDFVSHLRREGINVDGVVAKSHAKTGSAVIIVEEHSGENRILVTAGANALFEPNDFRVNEADATRHVALFQLEIPLSTVIAAMENARQRDMMVILNAAPALTLPPSVYALVDCLIVNESEAALLSGIPEAQLSQSLDAAAERFLEKGIKTVVITLGAQGAFLKQVSNPESRGSRVAGYKVKAVDTTAAGDTWCGAFAVFLAQHGDDYPGATAFANLAASVAVTKPGAQSSMPFLDELP